MIGPSLWFSKKQKAFRAWGASAIINNKRIPSAQGVENTICHLTVFVLVFVSLVLDWVFLFVFFGGFF